MEERDIERIKSIVKECNVYLNWNKIVAVTKIHDDEKVLEVRLITDQGADFDLRISKKDRFAWITPTKVVKVV